MHFNLRSSLLCWLESEQAQDSTKKLNTSQTDKKSHSVAPFSGTSTQDYLPWSLETQREPSRWSSDPHPTACQLSLIGLDGTAGLHGLARFSRWKQWSSDRQLNRNRLLYYYSGSEYSSARQELPPIIIFFRRTIDSLLPWLTRTPFSPSSGSSFWSGLPTPSLCFALESGLSFR